MKTRKKYLAVFFVVMLAVDQLTKLIIQSNLKLYDGAEVIPGFFNIWYVLNPGAAFGIFQHQSEMFRKLFFVVVTIAAVVFILFILAKDIQHRLRAYSYVMVMAGAVGNLIDRIRVGKVVDFLDFYYKNFHWYTFNVADIYITVGIGLLLIDMVFLEKRRKPVS